MPDITVQFEFGSEGSLSKSVTGLINAEINSIQSGILDKPLMLKFDIDHTSLSNIRSKIADMALELGASFGGSFGGSVSSSPVAGARRMAEATRDTTTAIQKQIASLVGLDRKAKSAEQSATAMERAWLNQREQAVKEEAKAVAKAEAEKAKATEQAARKKEKAVADAEKEQKRLQEQAAKQAEREAKQAEQKRQREEKEAQKAADKAAKDAVTVETSRKRQIENIAKAQADIDELGRNYSDKSFAQANLKELGNLAERLTQIKTELKNTEGGLDLNSSKQYANEVGNITTRISALKTELNTLNKISQDNFLTNPKAMGDAQREISRNLTIAQNSLKNYSAAAKASNPEVRESYQAIGELVSEYQKLSEEVGNGSITQKQFKNKVSLINAALTENNRIIKESGYAHKSFSDTISTSIQKFSQYFTATRLVMGAYRTMKQMVKETIAVNDEMTQLQIVTKASNQEMASYSKTAFDTAKRLGTSVTDVISATTTYARLGYNTQESSTLAELTTMLQSVGDIDASSAQSAVTAIVKAFDDIDISNISNISSVMDKLVAVGNGAPISVSELAEGLNNASSALSAAGNSFDESVALLTAANTTMQDAAKSSTGLRTIAARIRNTKTELDDLGETLTKAEYQDIVEALTNITLADGSKAKVSLTDANNELRSTYDIIKDIAAVWDYMGENERAALAETLAGNRQQNVFTSLVENFNEASNAIDLMSESTGAMQRAYDVFLTSTTAHINQFKAAFSELSTDLIDTGIMNLFIDIGRILVEIADGAVNLTKVFGPLSSVVTAFAGFKVVSGIKSFA